MSNYEQAELRDTSFFHGQRAYDLRLFPHINTILHLTQSGTEDRAAALV